MPAFYSKFIMNKNSGFTSITALNTCSDPTNHFSLFSVYCMYNLGVGGEVVKVVILILGVSSDGLAGS